jgi:hypothetical protein
MASDRLRREIESLLRWPMRGGISTHLRGPVLGMRSSAVGESGYPPMEEPEDSVGFIFWPRSEAAEYGWGTPYTVNLPLGTTLTSSAYDHPSYRQYRLAGKSGTWAVTHNQTALGGRRWKVRGGRLLSWVPVGGWGELAPTGKNTGYPIYYRGNVLVTHTLPILAVSTVTKGGYDYIYALLLSVNQGWYVARIRVDWVAEAAVGTWQQSALAAAPDIAVDDIETYLLSWDGYDINASCTEAVGCFIKPVSTVLSAQFLCNGWEVLISWNDSAYGPSDDYSLMSPVATRVQTAYDAIAKSGTRVTGYLTSETTFLATLKVPICIRYREDADLTNRLELEMTLKDQVSKGETHTLVVEDRVYPCEFVWNHRMWNVGEVSIHARVTWNDDLVKERWIYRDLRHPSQDSTWTEQHLSCNFGESACLGNLTGIKTINNTQEFGYLAIPRKWQNSVEEDWALVDLQIARTAQAGIETAVGWTWNQYVGCVEVWNSTVTTQSEANDSYVCEIRTPRFDEVIESSVGDIVLQDPTFKNNVGSTSYTVNPYRSTLVQWQSMFHDGLPSGQKAFDYRWYIGYWISRITGSFVPSAAMSDGRSCSAFAPFEPYGSGIGSVLLFMPGGQVVAHLEEPGEAAAERVASRTVWSGGDLHLLTGTQGLYPSLRDHLGVVG